jgi:glycosyltransferase involved in cell wall biosynthesis
VAPTRGTILHDVQQWLPASEGFVYDLITRSRHRSVIASHGPQINRARFPHPAVRVMPTFERISRWSVRRRAHTAALMASAVADRAALLHVHLGYRAPLVVGVTRRLRLPLVVSLHGNDVTAWVRTEPGRYDTVIGAAAAVTVPSRFLAAAAEAAGFPRERVHILPSGVDTSIFSPTPLPAGPPTAAFVGRLVEKKGLDVLLEAWPLVRQHVPEARLVVLGDGPLAHLVDDAARHGVTRLLPLDEGGRTQARDLMRGAHLVVSPSRTAEDGDSESLLVVNLEAQASGRPVVTTDHGGIPEFVRAGETALVVDEGDAGAVAEAMVRVMTDTDLAARLANAGPSWAARFDLQKTAAAVDDLYDDLLDRAPWWSRVTRERG